MSKIVARKTTRLVLATKPAHPRPLSRVRYTTYILKATKGWRKAGPTTTRVEAQPYSQAQRDYPGRVTQRGGFV